MNYRTFHLVWTSLTLPIACLYLVLPTFTSMINAAELRNGNLLNWSLKLGHPQTTLPDEIVEVFMIMEDKIAYVYPNIENRVEPFEDDVVQMGKGTIPFTELVPIPLTNEWLVKAGFVLDNDKALLKDGQDLPFAWNGKQLIPTGKTPLDYLHQLQNFYADATGAALAIAP